MTGSFVEKMDQNHQMAKQQHKRHIFWWDRKDDDPLGSLFNSERTSFQEEGEEGAEEAAKAEVQAPITGPPKRLSIQNLMGLMCGGRFDGGVWREQRTPVIFWRT